MSRSSRMLSTPVFEAPSISCTSRLRPSAISRQLEQAEARLSSVRVEHGLAVGPSAFEQLSALARMRAVVVLPTPRAPESRNAWPILPRSSAFCSVRVTVVCPTTSSKDVGRYLRARTL